MVCRRMKVKFRGEPDGMAFICGDLADLAICKCCGVIAENLCDYPVGNDLICDASLCRDCAVKIRGDIDYCPDHATEYGTVVQIIMKENNGSGI